MSDAPYIIIPPEHQSAPKVSPIMATTASSFRPPVKYHTSNDMELDEEQPHTRIDYELKHSRILERSPNQTIEALLQQHAKRYAEAQAQRWDGQKRWMGRENEEMRLVNILHCDTFIERLRNAGVNATSQDPFEWHRDNGVPSELWTRPHYRLWLNSFIALIPLKDEVTGKVRKVSSQRVGISAWLEGQPKTVTTLQHPYSPEYSIMRFNDVDVPVDEKYRGWRTAILNLVETEVLTEAEVEKAFGPALGPAGEFYREQMYRLRRISMGLPEEDE